MDLLNNEVLKDLGKNLKRHRINQNLSTKELAEKSGVHTNTINSFERGIANITINNLIQILRVLRLLDNLQRILPELPIISPIQLMELERKQKKKIRKK